MYVIVAALFTLGGLGCNRDLSPTGRMPAKTIQQVQEEHTDEWMAIPGVVGTAIGERRGKPCILVLAASNTEQIRRKIPATVEGYPVIIEHTGEIRALDDSQ